MTLFVLGIINLLLAGMNLFRLLDGQGATWTSGLLVLNLFAGVMCLSASYANRD